MTPDVLITVVVLVCAAALRESGALEPPRAGFREAFEDVGEFLVTTEAGGEGPEERLGDPSAVRPGGKHLVASVASVAVLVGVVALVATGTLHVALAGDAGRHRPHRAPRHRAGPRP
jgi:hypothetical protein